MKMKPVNDCPVPQGILIVIGGHENKGEDPEKEVQKLEPNRLEVLKAFVKLIEKENPVIEVITTASNEAEESFQDYVKAFTELGVNAVSHIHHGTRAQALEDNLAERVRAADGFFFSGGDQLKLTSIYGGTELLTQLKNRYVKDRIVIAGTSAGAMALSTPMIYAGNQEKQNIPGEIKVTTGLEFLKDVCIDTHFADRGRFVRMAQVIATNPTCIGMGISEDTAVIVRNGREAEVLGSGVIIIINGFHLTDSNIIKFGVDSTITIKDLRVHLLSRGDTYEIPQINPPHI